jgi:hypothetical protein
VLRPEVLRVSSLTVVAALLCVFVSFASPPRPINRRVEDPITSKRATKVAVASWEDRMGVVLPDFPKIKWYEGTCLVYSSFNEECIGGMTWDSKGITFDPVIHMAADDFNDKVYDDLVHELLHWALFEAHGNADSNHESPLWGHVPEVADKVSDILDKE